MVNMKGNTDNRNQKKGNNGLIAKWVIIFLVFMVLSVPGIMICMAKLYFKYLETQLDYIRMVVSKENEKEELLMANTRTSDPPFKLEDLDHPKLLSKDVEDDGEVTIGGVTLTKTEIEEKILEKQLTGLKDEHRRCRIWAEQGYCITHKDYMSIECQRSCTHVSICIPQPLPNSTNNNDITSDDVDDDESLSGGRQSKSKHQQKSSSYELQDLIHGVDFGVKQLLFERKYVEKEFRHINHKEVMEAITTQRQYLSNVVVNPDIKIQCRNKEPLCTVWAIGGACETDADEKFMKNSCAPACSSCHHLTIEGSCPINEDPKVQALLPGDVDKLFTRITTDSLFQKTYNVQIISSPATKIKPTFYNDYDTSKAPWIISFDNVLSQDEAQTLIDIGTQQGYKPSVEVADQNADGSWGQEENEYRTSTNSWCTSQCESNTTVQAIIERLSSITEIPAINSEFIQLVKYEKGQFYAIHHDFNEAEVRMQQGPRILTFFLYLNDVEKGGETYFDWLDIKVKPKMGRAVLWTNVFNDDPNERDERTSHEALPVKAGIKYGANAWIHMRDYRTPDRTGCIHR